MCASSSLPPRRILIARGDALGDMVLATVLIRPLREMFPEAEIYFLARKEMVPLLMGIPDVSGVIENTMSYAWKWSELPAFWRLRRQVKTLSPDVFIGLWEKRRYAFLSFLARVPRRLGYAMSWIHRCLYTDLVSVDFRFFFTHQATYNLALLGPLSQSFPRHGFETKTDISPRPYIGCPKAWRAAVESRYPQLIMPYVCVQVDGSAMQKTWLSETCIAVLRYVSVHYPQVVLVGRPDSARRLALDAGISDLSNIIDLTDQLSLPDVVAVLSRAQLFVGLDSGFAHLASAFSVPSVVYFVNRTQNALRWAPLGEHVQLVFSRHGCPDRCVPSVCQKTTCREGLVVSDLFLAIERAIHGKDGSRASCFEQLTVGLISYHPEAIMSFFESKNIRVAHVSPDMGTREMAKVFAMANVMWVVLDRVAYRFSYRLVRILVSNHVMWPPLFFYVKGVSELASFLEDPVSLSLQGKKVTTFP